jgi:large subunit ribosomal protein L21
LEANPPVFQCFPAVPRPFAAMYAIISEDGRQYKVTAGQTLDIDLREVNPGDTITFERVLAIGGDEGFRLGQPTVAGATVSATVVEVVKGDKLYVQKFRRRKNSKRRTGHRQKYTRVRIESIS